MIVAGIGCRRDCTGAEIAALVREAAGARALDALAVPPFRADHSGAREAAALLGLPLLVISDAALDAAQPRCAIRSDAALRATGVASVAEGAALAAAGPAARLAVPRITGARATCAVAVSP